MNRLIRSLLGRRKRLYYFPVRLGVKIIDHTKDSDYNNELASSSTDCQIANIFRREICLFETNREG